MGTGLDNEIRKCLCEKIFELRSEWRDGKSRERRNRKFSKAEGIKCANSLKEE